MTGPPEPLPPSEPDPALPIQTQKPSEGDFFLFWGAFFVIFTVLHMLLAFCCGATLGVILALAGQDLNFIETESNARNLLYWSLNFFSSIPASYAAYRLTVSKLISKTLKLKNY